MQTAGNPRRPDVRAARLARSDAARAPTALPRPTSSQRAWPQQLPRRARHDQGPDGQRRPHRRDDLHSVDEFKKLVVMRAEDGSIVRLEDVANGLARRRRTTISTYRVRRHAMPCSSASRWRPTPTYSTSRSACAQVLPEIQAQLPSGLQRRNRLRRRPKFISSSIDEVVKTLIRVARHRHAS
mgnify:CR=1 FL=1